MDNTQKFRERLGSAMERGTVTALAQRVGVHRGTLYDWRDGRTEPTIANAIALADALGWTLDYLTGRVDDPTARYGVSAEGIVDALAHVEAAREGLIAAARSASAAAAPGSARAVGDPAAAGELAGSLDSAADRRDAARRAQRGSDQGRGRAQAG